MHGRSNYAISVRDDATVGIGQPDKEWHVRVNRLLHLRSSEQQVLIIFVCLMSLLPCLIIIDLLSPLDGSDSYRVIGL